MGFNSNQRVLFFDPKMKLIKLTEEWLLKFMNDGSMCEHAVYLLSMRVESIIFI